VGSDSHTAFPGKGSVAHSFIHQSALNEGFCLDAGRKLGARLKPGQRTLGSDGEAGRPAGHTVPSDGDEAPIGPTEGLLILTR
jgi:hypothetical protein